MTNRRHGGYTESNYKNLAEVLELYEKNPLAFMERHYHIQDKDTGEDILYKARVGQRVLHDEIRKAEREKRRALILAVKSRQVGFSTAGSILLNFTALSRPNQRLLTMGHMDWRTEELFDLHHYLLDNLAEHMRMPVISKGRRLIKLFNGSKLFVQTAGTEEAGRGGVLHGWHASEVGSYKDLFALWTAYSKSISRRPGTLVLFEGTAQGTGSDQYTWWQMAEAGEIPFLPLFLNWFDDAECAFSFASERERAAFMSEVVANDEDLKWRMESFGSSRPDGKPGLTPEQLYFYWSTCQEEYLGNRLIMQQEFPCSAQEAFIASGQPTFPMDVLQLYSKQVKPGILYNPLSDSPSTWRTSSDLMSDASRRRNVEPYLEIWIPPQEGRRYCIAADAGRGFAKGDYSCAYVFDMKTISVVAVLHGRMEPTPFARCLAKLGEFYNKAEIAPEADGPGIAVLEVLKSIYTRIYRWRRLTPFGWEVTHIPGWDTSPSSRPMMINRAQEIFRARAGDHYLIPDTELIEELKVFVDVDGKPQAIKGCYDDRVMAWMIGIMVCLQHLETAGTGGSVLTAPKSGILIPDERRHFSPAQVKKNKAAMLGLRSFNHGQRQDLFGRDDSGF